MNTAPYVLHHAPGTRSVRVLWLLRELGLPHEVLQRSLTEFVMDRGYRQVNPSGRLPFLLDHGQPRSESLAILQTLVETQAPASPLWRPPGHAERAAMLEWMEFSETIQLHVQNLNQQRVFMRPEARSEPLIKLETIRMGKALGLVEQGLGDRDWLLPGGFSLADIAIGYTVAVSQAFRPLDEQPRLQAYLARLKARPAVGDLLDLPSAM